MVISFAIVGLNNCNIVDKDVLGALLRKMCLDLFDFLDSTLAARQVQKELKKVHLQE